MMKTVKTGCLLLLLAQPLSSAIYKQDNFESNSVTTNWTIYDGAPSITSTVNHGLYACKMTYQATTQALRTATGLNKSSTYDRQYVRFHVTTNPGSGLNQTIHGWSNSGGTGIATVRLIVTTGGALSLRLYNDTTATQIGSDYSISGDTWYRLECKLVVSATVGVLEMMVDGVSRASGTSLNTGSSNVDKVIVEIVGGGTSGSVDVYYDDIIFDDAAYPGPYIAPAISVFKRRSFP